MDYEKRAQFWVQLENNLHLGVKVLRNGHFLFCAFVISSLIGCSRGFPTTPTSVAEESVTPIGITSVNQSPTLPIVEQPTDTPVSQSLAESGPWLLFYPGFFVSNPDGSAFTKIEFPEMSTFYWSSLSLPKSINGGLIAAEKFTDVGEVELWIVQIPELKVKKIPLLGDQSIRANEEYIANEPFVEFLPPALGSLVYQHLIWSPDGRYLAFAGAIDGPSTDVYVYDRVQDSVTRISSGPDQTQILGWSPDSKWIISASTDYFSSNGEANLPYIVWANSIDGDEITKLYESKGKYERIIGWMSDNSFLAYSSWFEGVSTDLKKVNVETGLVNQIRISPFLGIAYNPQSDSLVFTVDSSMGFVPDIPPGLYKVNLANGTQELLFPGSGLYYLRWHPSLSQFSVTEWDHKTLTFDSDGNMGSFFPAGTILNPSPDGKWVIALNEDAELFESSGRKIADIGLTSNILWLPDSSGFLRLRLDSKRLYGHMLVENWKEGVSITLEELPESVWDFAIVNP